MSDIEKILSDMFECYNRGENCAKLSLADGKVTEASFEKLAQHGEKKFYELYKADKKSAARDYARMAINAHYIIGTENSFSKIEEILKEMKEKGYEKPEVFVQPDDSMYDYKGSKKIMDIVESVYKN